jgi:hypothetical protein
MLEFLKKKWVEWLISVGLVILTVMLTNTFTMKREENTLIKQELNKKASVEYVDKQDASTKEYVDKECDNTKELIKQAVDQQTERIKSVDHKLDILLGKK